MGTTPINALRYPASSDPADVPTDMLELATDLDTRLIPRFASSAARDAAITAPIEGQLNYRSDTDRLERYTGSAWVPVGGGVYVSHEEVTTGVVNSASTTEVLVKSMTFTAVVGVRYRYEVAGVYFGTVAADQLGLRVRYAAGATVTSAGTLAGGDSAVDIATASRYFTLALARWLPSGLTGQYTVGLFIRRTGGTGTVSVEATATNEFFHELIGHTG